MSYLELIIGPMFAGKTTELIRKVKRHYYSKMKCAILKYSKDIRYGNEDCLITHDRQKLDSRTDEIEVLSFSENWDDEFIENLEKFQVIGIDECQFFPRLREFCETLMLQNKIVYAAGLSADYNLQMFPEIINTLPLASHINFLSSVCEMCGNDHSQTSYLHKSDDQMEDNILIGGKDKYFPLCLRCYKKKKEEKEEI